MCSQRLDLELCALEAAVPFLRASLDPSTFEQEIEGYRSDLLTCAADEDERSEVHVRLDAALRVA